MTILEVDQLDANTLACIVGQNPEGALPCQPPVPRLQQLLAQSHHLVALVSDPSKVNPGPSPAATKQQQTCTCCRVMSITGSLCMSEFPVEAAGAVIPAAELRLGSITTAAMNATLPSTCNALQDFGHGLTELASRSLPACRWCRGCVEMFLYSSQPERGLMTGRRLQRRSTTGFLGMPRSGELSRPPWQCLPAEAPLAEVLLSPANDQ